MDHRFTDSLCLEACLLVSVLVLPACGGSQSPATPAPSATPTVTAVTTYHNDLARTGQYLTETSLTPARVASGAFSELFTQAVDGYVYGQPLYLPGVLITAGAAVGVHNVVFVATEHDSVYAFDADSSLGPSGGLLWKTSFLSPGVTTVPSSDTFDFYPDRRQFGSATPYCTDIVPEIGITSTPVIDPVAGVLYVVVRTKESGAWVQRLHALSVESGADVHVPQVIEASVPGTGDGSTTITFDPLFENQRAGLVLSNGVVYAAWASHCDASPNTAYGTPVWFHGWVIGFDAQTLAIVSTFVTTPDADPANAVTAYGPGGAQQGGEGGIWASGGAPAVDSSGYLYFMTANGIFDAASTKPPNDNYGDSLVKLATTTTVGGAATPALSVADYFTPADEETLETFDTDFGSGAPLLLPDQATGPPHLMVACGKEGTIFLVNRDNLGKFNPTQDQVVQKEYEIISGGTWSVPAYWNSHVYYVAADDSLKDFALLNGLLSTTPVASTEAYGWPGATPSVSANGQENGIVWVVDTSAFSNTPPGPAVLRAYNAANVSMPYLWSSSDLAANQGPPATKFSVPTIANGKVYLAGDGELTVYGLKSE